MSVILNEVKNLRNCEGIQILRFTQNDTILYL